MNFSYWRIGSLARLTHSRGKQYESFAPLSNTRVANTTLALDLVLQF